MTKAKSDDTDLGLYFQAAQHQPPIANEALLARVLADALAAQAAHGFPAPRAQPAVPLWRQLLAVLGGWQGVGGMATAGQVGYGWGSARLRGWMPWRCLRRRMAWIWGSLRLPMD